jgi:hypothetical protein
MFCIGKWGKVLDGKYADWFLMIEDDTNGSTGGFYIYTVKDTNSKSGEGYDDWVENEEALKRYMDIIRFQIDWNNSFD